MAIRVYILLFTLCILFGTSYQQLRQIRKQIGNLKTTIGKINIRTEMEISDLQNAVEMLQNKSEGNGSCVTCQSPIDDAALSHMEIKLKQQDVKITTIYKTVEDEKTIAMKREQEMSQIKSECMESRQLITQLKEQVQGHTIDIKTQENIAKLMEDMTMVKSELTSTKHENNELAVELRKIKSQMINTRRTNNRITTELRRVKAELGTTKNKKINEVAENKKETLELRQTNSNLQEQVEQFRNALLKSQETDATLKSELIHTERENDKLTVEFREVKAELMRMKTNQNKQSKQVKEYKQHLLEFRQMIMEMTNKKTEISTVTTTTRKTTRASETTRAQTTTTKPPTTTVQATTTKPPTTTMTVHVASCQDGWSQLHNTCYMYVRRKVTWYDAKARCAYKNAILAEPDTREKLQYLWQFSGRRYGIWVGGTDRQSEGTWIWSGSGRRMGSDLWYRPTGEPNSGRGDEDCLAMNYYGWYDGRCTWERSYMCEKDATV